MESNWRRNNSRNQSTDPEFSVARITSMNDSGISVSDSSKRIHLNEYQKQQLGVGDHVVLLQESNDNKKVLSILSKCKHGYAHGKIPLKKKVFTLDPPDTRHYDDAFSIEDCEKRGHPGCKIIGIHVAAFQTTKLCVGDLGTYSGRHFKNNGNGLKEKKYSLAVSVYVHSTDRDEYIPPELSVVYVRKNYKFPDDEDKYEDDRHTLWQCFGGSVNYAIAHTSAFNYLAFTPKIWKEFYILREAMSVFSNRVRQFFTKFPRHVITKAKRKDDDTPSVAEQILVPNNFFEDPFANDNELKFVAVSIRNEKMKTFVRQGSLFQCGMKYERSVEMFQEEGDSVVCSTSPIRKMQHYVNHQVLLHCLLGPSPDFIRLYKEEELLGILGIRFGDPKIRRAVVKECKETGFVVMYAPESTSSCKTKSRDITNTMLPSPTSASSEKIEIRLRGIFCAQNEYCNRKIISLEGSKYKEFLKDFCGKKNLTMNGCFSTREPRGQTYTKSENETVIELQEASELELQTSASDEYKDNDLFLRLLRIGKNCHYCFLHMNHPKLAFMSDRKDIRDMNLEEKIATLSELSVNDKLDLTQFAEKDETIDWHEKYLSGGTLHTDRKTVPGALLCIRKELKDKSGDVEYVWNAHAIVSACENGKVEFSICTLSQVAVPEEKCFRVDIISARKTTDK